MVKIIGALSALVAMTGAALASDPLIPEVSEAGPLGLVLLGVAGVAIAYRLRNRK